jgi:superfamily II DNA or RNA helicase
MNDMFRTSAPKVLRPHQEKAIALVRESLRAGNRRVVMQGATGLGKTLVAAKIIESALAKGSRVIFTAPAISLINQTVAAFENEGIDDIGVMQANHPRTNPAASVQIASVQTLARRDIPQASLLICDECHVRSEVIDRLMDDRPDMFFIGLSATPWAKGMGLRWQDLVIPTTIGELIEGGYLSRFTAFGPDVPDLSSVKTVAGDYAEDGLERVMGGAEIIGNVVSNWLEHGENRPTLCFAVNRAHADKLRHEFLRAGVSAAYVDAFTDIVEREHINRQFRAGDIAVICSVRTMTTGVDLPVSCIIDAAPTKSEMLHVQKIGRGLRVNPGTEDCLSADTLVLTDKGLCKINHITLDHKVWDGVNFVNHGGAVCRGVRQVVTYDGLTGTPEHRVMTEYGWRTLYEAASGRLRIARTGIGRFPLWFIADCVSQGGGAIRQTEGGGIVQSVQQNSHGAVSQHQETARDEVLPEVQAPPSGDGSEVAVCEVPRSEGPMPEPEFSILWPLRRKRHRIQVFEPECRRDMDCGDVGGREPLVGVGQNRQRWSLRARKSALGAPGPEHREQPKIEGLQGSVHRLSGEPSGGEVFGSLAGRHDPARDDGRRDSQEVGGVSDRKSSEEVWDILNAGPLQRFTANGRLVHNCKIFDHAGNSIRLGLVTDIHHDTLDATKPGEKQESKPPAEKLPTPCVACGVLFSGRECPACGKERKAVSQVEEVQGQLVQLAGKARVWTAAEKQAWWSGLQFIRESRGRSSGWASHAYREKFGVWPRGLSDAPKPATPEMWSWVKAKDIRYAKSRQ